MRELTYYVAVSLDGFIAGPEGQFDAFLFDGDHMAAINARFADAIPTSFADALGIAQDRTTFDTVLMGWNTYAVGLPAMPSPYAHLHQIVFTRKGPDPVEGVEFADRDPVDVVRDLKDREGGGIWLCGGGALAASLVGEIDRLVLKVNPVLFGEGIPLFGRSGYAPSAFTRTAATAFDSGVTLLEYERS
ncbi:dihydrofolate reductase family protein [Microbacterium sp. 22303]|uniref:dihydrofolate reductase family protein n=1 Tax=Microbacterium sp. 22303 TaxID=3453905 RepID=UPI003F82AD22